MSAALPGAWSQPMRKWLGVMLALQVAFGVISSLFLDMAGDVRSWLQFVGLFWLGMAIAVPAALLPTVSLPALHSEGRVLHARRAPTRAWRQRVATHSVLLGAVLGAAVLCLLLLGLTAHVWLAPGQLSAVDVLLPATRLCAVFGLVLLLMASVLRLLPRWAAVALGGALLVVLFQGPRLNIVAPGANPRTPEETTVETLLLCVFSAVLPPLALATVHRRLLLTTSAQALASETTATRRTWKDVLGAGVLRPFERWRRVDNPGGLWWFGFMLFQWLENMTRAAVPPATALLQPLGSSITPGHVMRILLFAFVAVCTLRSDALHWRHVVAPTGRLRATLGVRIVLETWVFLLVVVGVLLAVSLAVCTVVPLFDTPPWGRLPGIAADHVLPLASDLLLGTAVGACLRAWTGSMQRAVWAVGIALGVIAAISLALTFPRWRIEGPVLWHRDAAYLLGQLLLTALCMAAAQRAWKRIDLVQFVRPAYNTRR